MKREEILERLKKAEFIAAGNFTDDQQVAERIAKELETDFIPDLYDKAMGKTFNETYYENPDEDIVPDPDLNLNILKDKDLDSSVDGDFETEIQAELKQKAVAQANKRH